MMGTIRFIRKEATDLYVLCETSKNYTLALHDYSIFAREVKDLCMAIKYDTKNTDERKKRLIQVIYYFNASY